VDEKLIKHTEYRGFDPGRVKLRTNTLIVVASALSIHHQEKRTKTGWLGFRIAYPSGVIYHCPTDAVRTIGVGRGRKVDQTHRISQLCTRMEVGNLHY
jgi:hypothetical protein